MNPQAPANPHRSRLLVTSLGAFPFSSTLVVIAAAARALMLLTPVSLHVEIGSLPGPERRLRLRLRLFTVDSVLPRAAFAAGGASAAAAGVSPGRRPGSGGAPPRRYFFGSRDRQYLCADSDAALGDKASPGLGSVGTTPSRRQSREFDGVGALA